MSVFKGVQTQKCKGMEQRKLVRCCVRQTPLQCSTAGTQQDDFFVVSKVKPPDNPEWAEGSILTDCSTQCMNNCSCLAYAYHVGAGCMYWTRDLVDIQQLVTDGVDLYIRLPQSELGKWILSYFGEI